MEAALEAAEPRKGPRSLNPAVKKRFISLSPAWNTLDPPLDPLWHTPNHEDARPSAPLPGRVSGSQG